MVTDLNLVTDKSIANIANPLFDFHTLFAIEG